MLRTTGSMRRGEQYRYMLQVLYADTEVWALLIYLDGSICRKLFYPIEHYLSVLGHERQRFWNRRTHFSLEIVSRKCEARQTEVSYSVR